jgi:diguanylate cyclase (GGDEF)-like protein
MATPTVEVPSARAPRTVTTVPVIDPSRPFAPESLLVRIAPFAIVAILAQLSSALPGRKSLTDIWISLALLAACGMATAAPWGRLPRWLTVAVPLLFVASVLWLRLGQGGATSGVGIVILVPIVWTVLYQRRWESMVVVAAVVVANAIVSTMSKVPAVGVLRGAGFFAMVGVLVAFSVHDLRDVMGRALARQRELARRATAMSRAGAALTVLLVADEVVKTAVDLAAELASPPGAEGRRAQYYRIADGTAHVMHEFDDEPFHVDGFALAEHPYLARAVATITPFYGEIEPDDFGPRVARLVREAGVTHGAWAPVAFGADVDGVLALNSRTQDIDEDQFVQLQAVARLLELSLARVRTHELLQSQARTDELTGLTNRRGFDELLEHRPGRRPFAIIAIDIDGLKQLNDAMGHAAGDLLLKRIGATLATVLRRGDVLARVGGDEFVAFCFDADAEDAQIIGGRMVEAVRDVSVAGIPASVSLGIACGDALADARAVHALADAAMYEAKRAGGMQVVMSGAGAAVS